LAAFYRLYVPLLILIMGWISLFAVAVTLAMDVFAVSLAA